MIQNISVKIVSAKMIKEFITLYCRWPIIFLVEVNFLINTQYKLKIVHLNAYVSISFLFFKYNLMIQLFYRQSFNFLISLKTNNENSNQYGLKKTKQF